MSEFPPRLHVLLARDAPVGVVLRRGPAKAVCAVGWDRRRDSFSVGQWLRGRIYEHRSDLSPDGKHLIYFAMNGHWSSRAKGAWTAISCAPYLTAIALFAKGDCWHGGGLFVDKRRYWLNDGYGHEVLEQTTSVERADPAPWSPVFGGEDWGVYFPRLVRDGWTMRPDLAPATGRRQTTAVFEKPLAAGWTLRKLCHAGIERTPGKGVYWDEHDLVKGTEEHMRPAWEWADLDRDRLVFAEGGKLFAVPAKKPLAEPRLLHDFHGMSFERIRAPYA